MLTDAVFLFLTGAFIGWAYEVLLHLFKNGVFINRGMLHGPWLPIYGLGCLVMVGLKKVIGDRPIFYFFISTVPCAVLEYTSSWLSETIYHVRWWDYSNCPFNLNGRIFLGGLLGFGVAGCAFVFVLLLKLLTQRTAGALYYSCRRLGVPSHLLRLWRQDNHGGGSGRAPHRRAVPAVLSESDTIAAMLSTGHLKRFAVFFVFNDLRLWRKSAMIDTWIFEFWRENNEHCCHHRSFRRYRP